MQLKLLRSKLYNYIAYYDLVACHYIYAVECLKLNNFSISDFAVFNDHPPELHELCDAAAEIADLYDQIGMGLGLTHGQLRGGGQRLGLSFIINSHHL